MKAQPYTIGLAIGAAALGLTLAGCGHRQPRVETVTVRVPISTPCAIDPGPEPAPIWTPEAVAAAPHLYSLGNLLLAAFLQERARNAELRAALKGCSSTPGD